MIKPRKFNAKDVKGDSIHPRSRKAGQLQRTHMRRQKLIDRKQDRMTNRRSPQLDRITWFQMRIDPETISNHGLSKQEIDSLVQEYLARFEEEAQTIRAEQRPNRPVPKRLDEINHLISSEVAEYQSGPGLEIPDMATLNSVKALLAWDGTRESLNLLKLVRCKYEMS